MEKCWNESKKKKKKKRAGGGDDVRDTQMKDSEWKGRSRCLGGKSYGMMMLGDLLASTLIINDNRRINKNIKKRRRKKWKEWG